MEDLTDSFKFEISGDYLLYNNKHGKVRSVNCLMRQASVWVTVKLLGKRQTEILLTGSAFAHPPSLLHMALQCGGPPMTVPSLHGACPILSWHHTSCQSMPLPMCNMECCL